MNAKGIFFTFVVFLLIAAIVAAGFGMRQSGFRQKENITEGIAFNAVNSRFENIFNEVLTVKTSYPGRAQARILAPFEYDSGNMPCSDSNPVCPCTGVTAAPDGCGWIEISQSFPINAPENQKMFNEVYDALNLYAIFLNNFKADLNMNAEAAKSTASGWCASCDEPLSYLLLPECIKYDPAQQNPPLNLFISETSNCNLEYDPPNNAIAHIRVIDLNITMVEALTLAKEGSGGSGCQGELVAGRCASQPQPGTCLFNSFSSSNPKPYVRINISVPNCVPSPSCKVGGVDKCCFLSEDVGDTRDSERTIANHVGLSCFNEIWLKPSGNGFPIDILNSVKLGETPKKLVSMNYGPSLNNTVDTTTRITFNVPIEQIKFNAFGVKVSSLGFDMNREYKRGT
jgi:hypothetical protein